MITKTDWDKLFEDALGGAVAAGKRILLHCCCAPCAAPCLTRLSGADVTAYFFNPNIMPFDEYRLREENIRRLCGVFGVEYLEGEYKNSHMRFLQAAQGLKNLPEGGERCEKCFYLRLFAAAEEAKKGGFDYFCTTLTLSPHKNADLINKIGLEIEKETGVLYLPSDFKKKNGMAQSIELCKKHGIYRQNYCGCRLS